MQARVKQNPSAKVLRQRSRLDFSRQFAIAGFGRSLTWQSSIENRKSQTHRRRCGKRSPTMLQTRTIYSLLLPQEESYRFAKDTLMIREETLPDIGVTDIGVPRHV